MTDMSNPQSPRFRPDHALFVAILAISMFNQIWGERIEANGGVGYGDGQLYAYLARDLRGTVFGRGLDSYYVHLSPRPSYIWGSSCSVSIRPTGIS